MERAGELCDKLDKATNALENAKRGREDVMEEMQEAIKTSAGSFVVAQLMQDVPPEHKHLLDSIQSLDATVETTFLSITLHFIITFNNGVYLSRHGRDAYSIKVPNDDQTYFLRAYSMDFNPKKRMLKSRKKATRKVFTAEFESALCWLLGKSTFQHQLRELLASSNVEGVAKKMKL